MFNNHQNEAIVPPLEIPDWNRPKRGGDTSNTAIDPSNVEYVYNVTFVAPDVPDEQQTDLHQELPFVETDEENGSDYISGGVSDDFTSDYYFPIANGPKNEDQSTFLEPSKQL